MIMARVDFDFTPLLQSTPSPLLPCLDCIGTVTSEDLPADDLANGWVMMTQVSSPWCAMCASTISLPSTLQTPSQPVPPCAAPTTGEVHTRAKKASPHGPKGPFGAGDDVLGPFPG